MTAASPTDPLLAEFERRNAPRGLFERYAQGRLGHAGERMAVVAAAALAFAFVATPGIALAALVPVLVGEAIDVAVLRRALARLAAGADWQKLLHGATASASVQAMGGALAVAIIWYASPTREANLFAMACLAGAALNAGLVITFSRPPVLARLAIYGAVPPLLFAIDHVHAPTDRHTYDLMATLLMAYSVWVAVRYTARGYLRQRAQHRDLLIRRAALEEANQRLRTQRSEARQLASVAQNASDGVVIADRRLVVSWVNTSLARMLGDPLSALVGLPLVEVLHRRRTDLAGDEDLESRLAGGERYRGEMRGKSRDGSELWLEVTIVPTHGPDGALETVICIARDVTEARQQARSLAEAKRAAETAARAKAEFLATVSHEIRTPMNGIVGMAELLSEAGLEGKPRHYAETIRGAADALLHIVNDVLDLSRLEAGKLSIHPAPFDPAACLRSAVDLLRPQAEEKGLALTLDITPALPPLLEGDAGRIRQILINLIGNAIKFTDEGQVAVRVRHSNVSGRVTLTVAVEDTGIGIAPDQIEPIFERFAQASDPAGGTGLGLTVARMLARRMRGDIDVSSTQGAGSAFTLTLALPAVETNPAGRPVPEPAPAVPAEDTAGLRVLVADDNAINRILIERLLHGAPARLTFARDGQEAVEHALAAPPDVVFMDMSMPVMDGLEAAAELRRAGLERPVIVALTANAFAADRARCLAAGMDAFLSKPVRRVDLLEQLEAARAILAERDGSRTGAAV